MAFTNAAIVGVLGILFLGTIFLINAPPFPLPRVKSAHILRPYDLEGYSATDIASRSHPDTRLQYFGLSADQSHLQLSWLTQPTSDRKHIRQANASLQTFMVPLSALAPTAESTSNDAFDHISEVVPKLVDQHTIHGIVDQVSSSVDASFRPIISISYHTYPDGETIEYHGKTLQFCSGQDPLPSCVDCWSDKAPEPGTGVHVHNYNYKGNTPVEALSIGLDGKLIYERQLDSKVFRFLPRDSDCVLDDLLPVYWNETTIAGPSIGTFKAPIDIIAVSEIYSPIKDNNTFLVISASPLDETSINFRLTIFEYSHNTSSWKKLSNKMLRAHTGYDFSQIHRRNDPELYFIKHPVVGRSRQGNVFAFVFFGHIHTLEYVGKHNTPGGFYVTSHWISRVDPLDLQVQGSLLNTEGSVAVMMIDGLATPYHSRSDLLVMTHQPIAPRGSKRHKKRPHNALVHVDMGLPGDIYIPTMQSTDGDSAMPTDDPDSWTSEQLDNRPWTIVSIWPGNAISELVGLKIIGIAMIEDGPGQKILDAQYPQDPYNKPPKYIAVLFEDYTLVMLDITDLEWSLGIKAFVRLRWKLLTALIGCVSAFFVNELRYSVSIR
ncbi:uncharacterized protein BJ171DRAFT_503745 [Polychytrium aggregatum]|uniref:uncharacterized protein n=1 Tax=Polychytrium aggregatum TaxID=110093 RepID=UPI0022FEA715|nr:uncharacterized protein BJ171DRAFT_503745 [Polychytrium aggregatum]KAI9204823.1 hypothetical protein BJ171DRAFT_503745 [Polychytrium aggregatum]